MLKSTSRLRIDCKLIPNPIEYEPESEFESEPDNKLKFELESESEPELKSKLESKIETKIEFESEPKPKSEFKFESEPKDCCESRHQDKEDDFFFLVGKAYSSHIVSLRRE